MVRGCSSLILLSVKNITLSWNFFRPDPRTIPSPHFLRFQYFLPGVWLGNPLARGAYEIDSRELFRKFPVISWREGSEGRGHSGRIGPQIRLGKVFKGCSSRCRWMEGRHLARPGPIKHLEDEPRKSVVRGRIL